MAGFKLMKTFAEHFKFINDSTLLGNYNTGQAIDPFHRRLDEKREQFAKTAKIGYNSSNESLDNNTPQFTYGKLK
jgi:hypothetical protein|tara:strand:+ start:28 stop:252 length:225 start_codon:yes stop_codon:yes gene_type:complete